MARFSIKSIKDKYGKFILVGSVVFLLGLILNFPVHRLAPLVTTMIEKNTGYQISAAEMSIIMPPGISMKQVHVQGPPLMGVPVNHDFESIKVYPSVMSLLTYFTKKSLGISFKVQRGKEKWSGSTAHGPKYTDISITAKNLDYTISQELGHFQPMLAGQTLNVTSKFGFSLDFESPTEELMKNDFTKASGSLKVRSKNTTVESGMVGDLTFDDTAIICNLEKGKLAIEDVHLRGEKLTVDIEGSIDIQKVAQASKIEKADISLFVDPSLSQLASMVQMASTMNSLSFADSKMNFRISGPINNLQKWRVTDL